MPTTTRKPTHRALLAPALLLATAAPLSAQVSGLVIQYQAHHLQTTAGPPAPASSHQVSAFMSVVDGGTIEVYEVQVQLPGGSTHPTNNFGTLFTTTTFTYPTRAQLMAAWPNGPYIFTVVDGEPSGASYTLQQPSAQGLWPAAVPAFTPASFAALQQMNPALPITLTINDFIPDPASNGRMYGLTINRRNPGGTLGQSVYSGLSTIGAPVNSRTLPAGTLQPNTDYYASWIFEQRSVNPPPAGVQFTQVSFGHITRAPFTTGPAVACPADIGRQGGLAGADGQLDNNDFVVFIDYFFTANPAADFGSQGGVPGADGSFDNNDFVVFIDRFFDGC
ncbi:MAG TPA: GC-type dockerin domain-anchored protein [Phycisphaerales bacterium]|nr:GC-type dockerin domain-anchored protein [Phycisphaerales bacterium]